MLFSVMAHAIFSEKQMRFLWFFIVLTFLTYAYFYVTYPLQRQDTGWIAEPAQNLIEGNGFATHSRTGWMMMDAGTFWWPPFYFMLEAINLRHILPSCPYSLYDAGTL